jgi:hypothetical protein
VTRAERFPSADDREPDARPGTLDLMPPLDLPAELTLASDEAEALRTALTEFLHALDDPDMDRRLARVRALLADAGDGGETCRIRRTAIPAGKADVETFDGYFSVRRIGGDLPARSLLRGLLRTSAEVLSLAARGPGLPRASVKMQLKGFASYARLLGRVCGIGGLP